MFAVLGALALAAPAMALFVHSDEAGNPNNFHRNLLKREITTDVSKVTNQSFDFIVAGGGLAGLAVAARLAEWENTTVLVIEAGGDGSEVADQINIPGYSYLRGLSGPNSPQDWSYQTVPQPGAGNVAKTWPRGKVLGGSGATNGMFWGRGSKGDYDAWGALNSNASQTWNWDEMNKYIQKAENFTKPPQAVIDEFSMVFDDNAHGDSGPIHTGHSEFIYPAVASWIPAWKSLGFDAIDLNGGSVHGVMICPSTLNVQTQARSYAKSGYIDAQPARPNLLILTGQQVTKVTFNGTDSDGNNVASGVTFAAGNGQQEVSVKANKEVILSGGTIGSAQMLQLSGIGPKSVLEAQNIKVLKDLPVGFNLQDHVSGTIYFNTPDDLDTWGKFKDNAEAQAAALTQYRANQTGKWTYVNEAVGYVTMTDITDANGASSAAGGINVQQLVQSITEEHNLPQSVQQGITKQLDILKQDLTGETGQLEIILTMLGGNGNSIGIQVCLQRPFSRGTLSINSANAFDKPTIDPGYLTTDIDNDIVRGGLLFARKLYGTADMQKIMTSEPSANMDGNALLQQYKSRAGTEYHPIGTNSMLPEEDGGVVDTNLVVYGTKNVRVIDASIMPLHIAAHLMASTYGIAEKGADIIKQYYTTAPTVENSTTTSSTATDSMTKMVPSASETADSTATTSTHVDSNPSKNNTSLLGNSAKLGVGIGVGVGVAALLAAIIAFCCIKRKNAKRAGDEKGWYVGAAGGAAGADQGAWDANAAYSEQSVGMTRPQRPYSTAGDSINTMATADLQGTPRPSDAGYQMGDYARGGSPAPYQDYPTGGGYHTGFSAPGSPQPYGGR